MAQDLTGQDVFDAAVTVPEDGDDRNAYSEEIPFQQLANRTHYLNQRRAELLEQPNTWLGQQSFAAGLVLEPGQHISMGTRRVCRVLELDAGHFRGGAHYDDANDQVVFTGSDGRAFYNLRYPIGARVVGIRMASLNQGVPGEPVTARFQRITVADDVLTPDYSPTANAFSPPAIASHEHATEYRVCESPYFEAASNESSRFRLELRAGSGDGGTARGIVLWVKVFADYSSLRPMP